MKFSWDTLKKPFTVLAPMEGVTDTVFRQIIAEIYKPDVMFTEFVSVEGLFSQGREDLISKLLFDKSERPLVAQIWGVTPDLFYRAAKDIAGMGFDGIDINMGCPDKNVVKKGAGAALIENPDLAGRIIHAVGEGVRSSGSSIPISVKTRIGYGRRKTEEWIRFLLSTGLDALTVHGITAKEQHKKTADWNEIKKAVDIRNSAGAKTIMIGNGNILSYQEVQEHYAESGVDGIMIGRGILQNINCFNPDATLLSQTQFIHALERHLILFQKTYGLRSTQFVMMKKFYRVYVRDYEGSGFLREQLMEAQTVSEALKILREKEKTEAKMDPRVSRMSKV